MSVHIKAAQDAMRALGVKAKEVVENGDLTAAEKKTALDGIETDLKGYSDTIAVTEQAQRLMVGGEAAEDAQAKSVEAPQVKSLADSILDSDAYAEIVHKAGVHSRVNASWEHPAMSVKVAGTTITEGGAASGYGLDGTVGVGVTPNFLPGIVDLRFQPLTVADLMSQGATSSPLISYVVETGWNDNAAAVAEGGLKPQSDGAFSRVTDQVGKIANTLKVTDEMVQDAPQFRSFLTNRLVWSIQRQEEVELLNGTGYPGLKGLLTRTGLLAAVTASAATPSTIIEAVFSQITNLRTVSFTEPDAFVIHPVDWEKIRLAKDANNQYYAGGPFAYGPYGNGAPTNEARLWGLRGVVTTAQAQGSILVGAFKENTMIFRKQGITLETTNANEDDFKRNLIAVRAEERAALSVFRPQAFGPVSIGV